MRRSTARWRGGPGRRDGAPRRLCLGGTAAPADDAPAGAQGGDHTTGCLLRLSRGRYALPTAALARIAGERLTATVCLRSAAAHHGWELKIQPEVPELMVRRGRKLSSAQRTGVDVHWSNVADDQVRDGVTTPLRTVIDCARVLPFDEALAVADSALRSGKVARDDLRGIDVRGAGAAAVRRVLVHADGRAANPFESVLRALCIEAGLVVEPQLRVQLGTGVVRPDLVCLARRLVLEADSWTFHASRKAHGRDCARYNLLVIRGWSVLRFTWEQVMLDQAYVRWVLAQLLRPVERPQGEEDLALPA